MNEFTLEELKNIKFASYILIEKIEEAKNLNSKYFSDEAKKQKKIHENIIKKIDNIIINKKI